MPEDRNAPDRTEPEADAGCIAQQTVEQQTLTTKEHATMITFDAALSVFTEIRGAYKGQIKSSNKQYDATTARAAGLDQSKIDKRNQNLLLADSRLGAQRTYAGLPGMTACGYGQALWNRGTTSGNCWDMACMASFRVRERFNQASFIANIDRPGDHAFCFVCDDAPGFNQIRQLPDRMEVMRNEDFMDVVVPLADPWGWVVDPWLNICCGSADYKARAASQLEKWTREGKRIWWYTGWVEPKNPGYVNGFLTGHLTFKDSQTP